MNEFEAWVYSLLWRYPRTTRYILVVILVACVVTLIDQAV